MSVVEFHTSEKLELIPYCLFFNSPEYQNLVETESSVSFNLIDALGSVLARIHFNIENGIATSFSKAPFGFLETNIDSKSVLVDFINQIEAHLKSLGIGRIILRSWPIDYPIPSTGFIFSVLMENGFAEIYADYDFYLNVTDKSSLEFFKKPERKRLRKCLNAGLTFLQIQNFEAHSVYKYLSDFRKQKEIPLNITEKQLELAFLTFPDKYFVFEVRDKKDVIGISVCVEANMEILYHFVLASDSKWNNYSPSVLLYDGIYRFCQQRCYKIFDFGTASIEGKKQEGLFKFKANLGASVCLKPVLSKLL